MKRPVIASEAALAEVVSSWLRADGWRTYHEVDLPRGGRADIIAARRGLVWLVETKLRGGLEVLDQALDRRRSGSNGVLVAVPGGPAAGLLAGISGLLGVGVIAVEEREHYDGRRLTTALTPAIKVWPAFDRKAPTREILRWCTPGHEAQAAGVTGSAVRWTPFKAAVREVIHALAAAPEHSLLVDQLALAEAVREYKHGFVEAQLRRWLCWAIGDGLVPGCSLGGRGKERAVVLDPASVTAAHRRDLQLDELDRRLAVNTPAPAVVARA